MNIYLIRHGETDLNKAGTFQGRLDMSLNKTGRQQAMEAGEEIAKLPIDIIISSPLKRTIETAQIIAEKKSIPIIPDKRFIERSFGKMEGRKPTKDIYIQKLLDFSLNYSQYDIEPIQDLRKRVFEAIEQIKQEQKGKNILIVTHGGVIEVITSYFKPLSNDRNLLDYRIGNCELRQFYIKEREKERLR